jgi:glycerol-3-phosphate dehydrogenase
MSGPYLTRERRARELETLDEVDVLVIGGGVTGCGVALDAASRRLSVALVEKDDLAHGTSRWSSKLVHGGLRYLASGDVGLALDSARERDVLLRRTARTWSGRCPCWCRSATTCRAPTACSSTPGTGPRTSSG